MKKMKKVKSIPYYPKGKSVEVYKPKPKTIKKPKLKPKKKGLTKIEKIMIRDMYYNNEQPINSLKSTIKYSTGTNPRISTVEKNIKILKDKGLVLNQWRSEIPAFRNKRYKEVHYGLTSKGFKEANNLPIIKREFKRKEREYEEDARRSRKYAKDYGEDVLEGLYDY